MKKLKFILIVLCGLLTLNSCSEDENPEDNNNDLLGVWFTTDINLGFYNKVTFTSDNRASFFYEGQGNNGQDFTDFADWSKNGNTLTISWDDADPGLETAIYEIVNLNETTLEWKTDVDGEIHTEILTKTPSNSQDLQERLNNGETPYEIYLTNNNLLTLIYGLNYQGGIIFYLDTNDGTGMICSPNDLSTNIVWGCEGINISGAEFSSIGSGITNTQEIVANCNDDVFAAKICASFSLNGNDEWYLPSKDELNLVYLNLKTNNIGNFSDAWYWTSTEFEDQSTFDTNGYEAAWIQSFNDGSQATYDVGIKHFENSVRAIRNY